MGILTFAPNMLPRNPSLSVFEQNRSLFASRRRSKKKNLAFVPVARLFGPAIFEASKLRVLYLGVDEKKHPGKLARTYTLTHSDITSKLTLAISQTINNSQLQGWANKFYRDEVVAEWKKVKGKMSLHVHCHISGGHFLLDLCARLRYFIFCKELPVVLKAFVHGDDNLLQNYPELKGSLVWVYFHSNIPEFNKVECWGPLVDTQQDIKQENLASNWELPQPCQDISNWELPQPCQDISNWELPQPCQDISNWELPQPCQDISNWELPQPCQDKCECCFPHKSLPTKMNNMAPHNQEQLPLPNLETIE